MGAVSRSTVASVGISVVATVSLMQPGVGAVPWESPAARQSDGTRAFVGATVIDGTGGPALEDAVIVVRGGRIAAFGPREQTPAPEDTPVVDVTGRYIVPGLVNAHGHVGDTLGLESNHYSEQNVLRQLALYARYGVTTVNSLGGDGEAARRVRDGQSTPSLTHARLRFAGPVVAATTAEDARAQVDQAASLQPDFIKIRVDDNLGTTSKMPAAAYEAVIERASEHGLPVAAHVFYLDDAKALLRAGVGLIAHSVRDTTVDDELVTLLLERDVCYCPTLVREVSTFVYGSRPDFFDDPFLRAEVEPGVLEQLADSERQRRVRESEAARRYRLALDVAQDNLGILADRGVRIAFGTDSGPPARFHGYFEHLELALMTDAGLTPMQALVAATGGAASCIGADDVGTIEPGKWADLVVLESNPLADISNSRTIESVWIAGNRVPGPDAPR